MSFQHTTLLECNREQSVQRGVEGDNHAIFTNRMGKVVELDVGDTISVKSAFINKRGSANPNSIEFKGETIGVNVSFRQTATASENPTTYSLDNKYPTLFNRSSDLANAGAEVTEPYVNGIDMAVNHGAMNDIAFKQIFTEEVQKDIKDNEMFLETEYYRNADGGNYTFLPRRYKRTDGKTASGIRNFYGVHNPDTQYWERCDFDWDLQDNGAVTTVGIVAGGSGYTDTTPVLNIEAGSITTSGTGIGLTLAIIISSGIVTVVNPTGAGEGYAVDDTLTINPAVIPGGSGLSLKVSAIGGKIYEKGVNSGICRYQPDLDWSGRMQNIQNGLLRGMLMEDYHFVGQGITYGPNTAEIPEPHEKETLTYFVDVENENSQGNSGYDFAKFQP